MFDTASFVACARRPAGARGWVTDNRGLSDWFSRNGSIFKETRLHIQNGWERDRTCILSNGQQAPQRKIPHATSCVVRYVACGNLKHGENVLKNEGRKPGGACAPRKGGAGCKQEFQTVDSRVVVLVELLSSVPAFRVW